MFKVIYEENRIEIFLFVDLLEETRNTLRIKPLSKRFSILLAEPDLIGFTGFLADIPIEYIDDFSVDSFQRSIGGAFIEI